MEFPSVARRSPAITTPSAKRSAATVVPWGIRSPAGAANGAKPTVAVAPEAVARGRGGRHLKPPDESSEVGPRILRRREERQGHLGYSPPFCT